MNLINMYKVKEDILFFELTNSVSIFFCNNSDFKKVKISNLHFLFSAPFLFFLDQLLTIHLHNIHLLTQQTKKILKFG